MIRRVISPVDVVSDERDIEAQREELASDQEQHIEEHVQDVFRQHQRIQRATLIDRVLVIRLELVERDDLQLKTLINQ